MSEDTQPQDNTGAPRERIDNTDPLASFDPEVDPDYPDATTRRGRGRDDRK